MSTFFPSSNDIARKWYVVDASGKTLGRLATEAASMLGRQEKPEIHALYRHGRSRDHRQCRKDRADRAEESDRRCIAATPAFPAACAKSPLSACWRARPEKIVEDAIKGMLPKSKMGRQMATKLKVYRGDKHPHQAQQPPWKSRKELELAAQRQ